MSVVLFDLLPVLEQPELVVFDEHGSVLLAEPLCVHLDVPGPRLMWVDPTPSEGDIILTYMGCPLTLTLVTEDLNNYFDLSIVPHTEENALPDGNAFNVSRECGRERITVLVCSLLLI